MCLSTCFIGASDRALAINQRSFRQTAESRKNPRKASIGGKREFSPGWIKQLHVLLCRSQASIRARDPRGSFHEIPFEHGVYKRLPNNPTLPDESVHEYCPPEHVAAEMEQLVRIHAGFHPAAFEVRAAWLHHAFTQIHPFQDGNGRVARALASIDLIRADLFPLTVDRDERNARYIPALEHADNGELQPLVQFFADVEMRAIAEALSQAGRVAVEETHLSAILESARNKVELRKQGAGEARERMTRQMHALSDAGVAYFEEVAAKLHGRVPDVVARVDASTAATDHYWRAQIVRVAKERRYWADLRLGRHWIRLQIRDGGVADLVVSLHFVGNPSPGTAAAAAFLEFRDVDAPMSSEGGESAREPVSLPQRALVFAPDEEPARQAKRFRDWLAEVVPPALTAWQRRL